MRSPSELGTSLEALIAAWERLAPEDTFAGLTLAEFKAVVQPSFAARARLDEIRIDSHQWLIRRALADEVSGGKYQQVVLGIRCHAVHGNNSAVLRAAGYVTDLERASGLSRTEGVDLSELPDAPPPSPSV